MLLIMMMLLSLSIRWTWDSRHEQGKESGKPDWSWLQLAKSMHCAGPEPMAPRAPAPPCARGFFKPRRTSIPHSLGWTAQLIAVIPPGRVHHCTTAPLHHWSPAPLHSTDRPTDRQAHILLSRFLPPTRGRFSTPWEIVHTAKSSTT